MSINTIKATMQMRSGREEDFDSDQMTPGEWAVSIDTKYVRMCFAPGMCLRMATYEAFEQDMKEIQTIIATCQNIQEAVEAWAKLAEEHMNAAAYSAESAEDMARLSESWAVGGTGTRAGEDTDNSKYYSERSRASSEEAKGYVDEVEQKGNEAVDKIEKALDVLTPSFLIDLSTGHILYDDAVFMFEVNRQNGHLEWGLAV